MKVWLLIPLLTCFADVHAQKPDIKSKPVSPPPKTGTASKPETPDELSSKTEFQLEGYPSQVRIRTSHNAVGRFDTNGSNALRGIIVVSSSGEVTSETIEFTIKSLKSDVPLRDQHLKEKSLQMEKFSTATFSGLKSKLGDDHPFEGKLKVLGVEKDVKGMSSIHIKDHLLQARFSFSVKYPEFGIPQPWYMKMSILDEIEIQVDMTGIPEISEVD